MSSLTDALEYVRDAYRIDVVAARSDAVTIFRVFPHHNLRVMSAGDGPAIGDISDGDTNSDIGPVRVGETVFLGIVHYPIPDNGNPSHPWREAKRLIGQAARRIDPDVAGFPEWNRIYADDPYYLGNGVAAGLHWGAFQITSNKRAIHQMSQKLRTPFQFSARQRRLLLDRMGHQCQRCGFTESLEVDHIVPVSHGGTNDDTNALVLCKACHVEKTKAERKIIGLSQRVSERNSAAHRAEIERITASPASLMAELKRRTGFAIAEVDE